MLKVITLIAALVVVVFAYLTPLPADAQQLCLVRGDAVEKLKQQYGERAAAFGLVEGGQAVVELFTNDQGSWTLLVTRADGQTCVIGTGQAWTAIPEIVGSPA